MKKLALLAVVVVALGALGVVLMRKPRPVVVAHGVPDRPSFARAVADAVRARSPDTKVEIDDARFVLRWEQGERRGEAHLARSFFAYAALPFSERDAFVKQRAATIGGPEIPATYAEAEPRLVAVVRARIDHEVARIAVAKDPLRLPPEPPHVAITEDLWGVLALETDEQFARLDGTTLERWNVPFDIAWRGALARLEQRSADITPVATENLWAFHASDANDSARVLLPRVLAKLPVRGDAVLAVAGPEELLAVDASEPAALEALADRLVEQFEKGPTNLRLLRLHDGKLAPLTVAADDPFHARLVDLEVSADQHDEKLQREALRARPDSPFAASIIRMRNPDDGSELRFVVHSEDEPTLLPRAEWVVFRRVDLEKHTVTTLACGPWDRVAKLMESRWKPTSFHPARWLATDLPTPAELAQLGCDQPGLRRDLNVARPIR